MLAPKRVKYRKWQKGRLRGLAHRGSTLAFGDIGLKTTQHGHLSSQQIEAARIAMMRHIRRGGKVWIRVLPRSLLKPVRVPVRVLRSGGVLRSSPAASSMKSRACPTTSRFRRLPLLPTSFPLRPLL